MKLPEFKNIRAPGPTQLGIASNCNEYYHVKKFDHCYGICSVLAIDLDDFLKWNPGAGSDCKTLQYDTYACISVAQDPVVTHKVKVDEKDKNADQPCWGLGGGSMLFPPGSC
ncbi:hypothetical protein QQS21_009597 [Conoideocrella luteorostrata]|uniref:LysM domain-containing protein n=1 Tax=Conoideocrella luteorostrata TaxID=1105319 RepID=A0AAJ0CGQ0_9HYPO|nr:hypothetical protein QQS21_009597 [Conoideocrella luteorostrata]